jgi:hypothetical protein
MLRRLRLSSALLIILPLFAALISGCAAGVEYRTYDPYYHDYHVWSDAEVPYYNRWIIETHHGRVDYGHLNKHDREEYWRWRHDHH